MRPGRSPHRDLARVLPLLCALFAFAPSAAFGSEFSERGIRLFMENKPQEAVPVLDMASKEPGVDEKVFLYLGIAYQQLGKWDDAIAAFRKGLSSSIHATHSRSIFLEARGLMATAGGMLVLLQPMMAARPGRN